MNVAAPTVAPVGSKTNDGESMGITSLENTAAEEKLDDDSYHTLMDGLHKMED